MSKTEELSFSVIVNDTVLNKKQIAFAIRDFIRYIDPSAGLVYVSQVPEQEDGAVAFFYDSDRYPQMAQAQNGSLL